MLAVEDEYPSEDHRGFLPYCSENCENQASWSATIICHPGNVRLGKCIMTHVNNMVLH